MSSKLAIGVTSKPMPATWVGGTNNCHHAQQQTLYSRSNPTGTRKVAVKVYFSPASSSAAIGAGIFSTQAYQNLDYTFKRVTKP